MVGIVLNTARSAAMTRLWGPFLARRVHPPSDSPMLPRRRRLRTESRVTPLAGVEIPVVAGETPMDPNDMFANGGSVGVRDDSEPLARLESAAEEQG